MNSNLRNGAKYIFEEEFSMKKLLAIVMALVLCLSLASFVSAEGFSGEIKVWVAEEVVEFTKEKIEE